MDVQDVILQQAFNFAAMCWAYTPEDLTEEEKRLRGLIVLGTVEDILDPFHVELDEIIEFMDSTLRKVVFMTDLSKVTTRDLLTEIKIRGERETYYIELGIEMVNGAEDLISRLPGSMLDCVRQHASDR